MARNFQILTTEAVTPLIKYAEIENYSSVAILGTRVVHGRIDESLYVVNVERVRARGI